MVGDSNVIIYVVFVCQIDAKRNERKLTIITDDDNNSKAKSVQINCTEAAHTHRESRFYFLFENKNLYFIFIFYFELQMIRNTRIFTQFNHTVILFS